MQMYEKRNSFIVPEEFRASMKGVLKPAMTSKTSSKALKANFVESPLVWFSAEIQLCVLNSVLIFT
jgi:hypothetical protein